MNARSSSVTCSPSFAALYCDEACAARGWREGRHKRACAAVRALLSRTPLYVQRAGSAGDDAVTALLSAKPALLATTHAVLRRFAEERCKYETLYYAVQDGLVTPEAVVEKLRRGTFMTAPCDECFAASPKDNFADDDAFEAYYARPLEQQGFTRHEAWLLFAGLGESGAARAADMALDALYVYAAALWEARWAMRTPEPTPEQRELINSMTARGVAFDLRRRTDESATKPAVRVT